MTAAVLIVDDQDTSRKVLSLVLEMGGFSTSEAESGREALEVVDKLCPQVVVTDIHMPDMNGRVLARQIAERANPSPPPVIAVTADHHIADRLREDDSFSSVLTKPVDPSTLIAAVQQALRQPADRGRA